MFLQLFNKIMTFIFEVIEKQVNNKAYNSRFVPLKQAQSSNRYTQLQIIAAFRCFDEFFLMNYKPI